MATEASRSAPMRAGFGQADITPPAGTRMLGFQTRDKGPGCTAAHDPLLTRAVCLEQGRERVLLLGLDVCLLGREEADRFKGAIGRRHDLSPRQILINTSHTHVGPATSAWAYGDFLPPEREYLRQMEAAVLAAVARAVTACCPVTLAAGVAECALPLNRRKPDATGRIAFQPNPAGPTDRTVPLCLLRAAKGGAPVALLLAVSCHPSSLGGTVVSADYPGAALRRINAHLGADAGVFLQGTGGDAKPKTVARDGKWISAGWEEVEAAGAEVAATVLAALPGLKPVQPALRAVARQVVLPLQPVPDRAWFGQVREDPGTDDIRRRWAERQIARLDHLGHLPAGAELTLQGVRLARGVRMVALEGEPVAELGFLMRRCFRSGVTFALGYTNGEGLYLPTSAMLAEGGYEVESYYEYGLPAPLASGIEAVLEREIRALARFTPGGEHRNGG